MNERLPPGHRSDYRHFLPIATRWNDNDSYRHVNNAVYVEYFDTVVNQFLVSKGVLDLERSSVVGLVVETQCRYFSQISFPSTVYAGLRVGRIGNSSVRYEIGLFRDDAEASSAEGHFVHVYVDRGTQRPVPLPDCIRGVLVPLLRGRPAVLTKRPEY